MSKGEQKMYFKEKASEAFLTKEEIKIKKNVLA